MIAAIVVFTTDRSSTEPRAENFDLQADQVSLGLTRYEGLGSDPSTAPSRTIDDPATISRVLDALNELDEKSGGCQISDISAYELTFTSTRDPQLRTQVTSQIGGGECSTVSVLDPSSHVSRNFDQNAGLNDLLGSLLPNS